MAVKLGNGNWAVKEDKLLAYNDNSGLFFNKEFDFSRGTSATYVAKDGLIKTAGIQPNIVTNGDFATDSDWTKGSGWSISGGKAVGSATGASLYQADGANYTSGKLYKITFEVSDYVSGSVRPEITNVAGSYVSSNGVFVQYITATSSPIGAELKGSTFTGSVDNITVQEIQTDTPRIDFTNDTKGHLLLEPSRTNLFPYSEDFSTWNNNNNAVVTDNFTISPDGTQTASKFTFDGTTNGNVQKPSTVTDSTQYTFSIWLKNDNLADTTQVWLAFRTSSKGQYITVTNEWQRFTITQTASGTTEFPRVQTSEIGSLFAWGAQFEEGGYATSYIPTTGATSTRNADVSNNSGSAQDFNDSEGVLYAEIAALADDFTSRVLSISNGSTNERVQIAYQNVSNRIKAFIIGGGTSTSLIANLTDITDFVKVALKYKSGDYALWVGGIEVQTKTSAFTPTGLSELAFDSGSGGNDFYGKVRNLQVFTEALTDAELQELTS